MQVRTKIRELPEKPSAGLRVCLDDLRFLEGHKDYKVDLNSWHSPEEHQDETGNYFICRVCVGGAHLARLADAPSEKIDPDSFMGLSERERGKIQAMNAFRLGVIDWGVRGYYGYEQTHPAFPDLEDDIREVGKWADKTINEQGILGCPPNYENDREAFFKFLYGLADRLEKAGH